MQSSMEPVGDGLYLPLRMMEKSKPVPNMEDPAYSHMQPPDSCPPAGEETSATSVTKPQENLTKKNKRRFKIK